jgi:hypothetical protein
MNDLETTFIYWCLQYHTCKVQCCTCFRVSIPKYDKGLYDAFLTSSSPAGSCIVVIGYSSLSSLPPAVPQVHVGRGVTVTESGGVGVAAYLLDGCVGNVSVVQWIPL